MKTSSLTRVRRHGEGAAEGAILQGCVDAGARPHPQRHSPLTAAQELHTSMQGEHAQCQSRLTAAQALHASVQGTHAQAPCTAWLPATTAMETACHEARPMRTPQNKSELGGQLPGDFMVASTQQQALNSVCIGIHGGVGVSADVSIHAGVGLGADISIHAVVADLHELIFGASQVQVPVPALAGEGPDLPPNETAVLEEPTSLHLDKDEAQSNAFEEWLQSVHTTQGPLAPCTESWGLLGSPMWDTLADYLAKAFPTAFPTSPSGRGESRGQNAQSLLREGSLLLLKKQDPASPELPSDTHPARQRTSNDAVGLCATAAICSDDLTPPPTWRLCQASLPGTRDFHLERADLRAAPPAAPPVPEHIASNTARRRPSEELCELRVLNPVAVKMEDAQIPDNIGAFHGLHRDTWKQPELSPEVLLQLLSREEHAQGHLLQGWNASREDEDAKDLLSEAYPPSLLQSSFQPNSSPPLCLLDAVAHPAPKPSSTARPTNHLETPPGIPPMAGNELQCSLTQRADEMYGAPGAQSGIGWAHQQAHSLLGSNPHEQHLSHQDLCMRGSESEPRGQAFRPCLHPNASTRSGGRELHAESGAGHVSRLEPASSARPPKRAKIVRQEVSQRGAKSEEGPSLPRLSTSGEGTVREHHELRGHMAATDASAGVTRDDGLHPVAWTPRARSLWAQNLTDQYLKKPDRRTTRISR